MILHCSKVNKHIEGTGLLSISVDGPKMVCTKVNVSLVVVNSVFVNGYVNMSLSNVCHKACEASSCVNYLTVLFVV